MPVARILFALALIIGALFQSPTRAAAATEQEQFQTRLSAGVARLVFFVGDWTVVQSRPTPSGWVEQPPMAATFRSSMNNLYAVGNFTAGAFSYEMVFSYDAAQSLYRIASRDDQSGLIDIYEGDFDSSGSLIVSNLTSGTHYAVGGVKYFNRLTFAARADGWSVLVEASRDGGVTWRPQSRAEARRKH
jgi:hypothetical protein